MSPGQGETTQGNKNSVVNRPSSSLPGNQRPFWRSWFHPCLSVAHLLPVWFQPSPVGDEILKQTRLAFGSGVLPFPEFILGASGLAGDLVGTMPSTYDVLGQLRASDSNSKTKFLGPARRDPEKF